MNPRQSLVRKFLYMAGMAILLFPLYWLSQPATTGVKGRPGSAGGALAQLRSRSGLSETQLGEMDPTSETIKLATFGLRGVAANFLWEKANDYKMKKDWDNLSATLRQITKVEPHFIEVWRHQAWNLAYNVSAEFDDYRERFRWVIKGIQFLEDGVRYNDREPRLGWYVGWFYAQKIGKADEKVQFRRLFKDPNDFYGIHTHDPFTHAPRPLDERDNWLVGKEWFTRAEEMVDEGGALKGMSPVVFYSDRVMSQMNYGESLEGDGIFEAKTKRAWNKAFREWTSGPPAKPTPFGIRDIPTALEGKIIHLIDQERLEKLAQKLQAQLEAYQPGLRQKLVDERRQKLPAKQIEALDTPEEKRNADQRTLAYQANDKLRITHLEVAERVTTPERAQAIKTARELSDTENTTGMVRRYRQIVNYEFWRQRAEIEQTDDVRAAREAIYVGQRAYDRGDLVKAKESFDEGLALWRKVLNQYPNLLDVQTFGEDLIEVCRDYSRLLQKRDEPFPKPFILQDVIDRYGNKAVKD